MGGRHYEHDFKMGVIAAALDAPNKTAVAVAKGVPPQTLWNWLKEYESGALKPSLKFDSHEAAFLVDVCGARIDAIKAEKRVRPNAGAHKELRLAKRVAVKLAEIQRGAAIEYMDTSGDRRINVSAENEKLLRIAEILRPDLKFELMRTAEALLRLDGRDKKVKRTV